MPYSSRFVFAVWITCLTSATPDDTAFKMTKLLSVVDAIIEASVVLPVPGGPKKIELPSLFDAMARLKKEFLLTKCSWPKKSSKDFGRIRSASGASFFVLSENKLSILPS